MASVLNLRPRDGDLRLEDVTCGICLSILVEPVTMPCLHELCMPCFEQQVRQTSLHCPMCRVRIGSWARKAARENRLIDEKRWSFIRKMFPGQVGRRLAGLDEESPEKSASLPKPQLDLAKPGEIRKEFEEQLRLYEEERQRQQRQEEEESLKLIRLLQAQHEVQSEKLTVSDGRKSKRIASRTYTNPTGTRWKRIVHVPDTPEPDEPVPSTSRASRSPSAESEDSIARELRHFKPIQTAPKTPPKNPATFTIRTPRFVTAASRSLTAQLDAEAPCPNPVLTRSPVILESERWHRVPRSQEADGALGAGVESKRCRGRPRKASVGQDEVPSDGKENERKMSARKRGKTSKREDDDKVYACKLQQYYNMCGQDCAGSPYQLRSRAK